MTKTNWADLLIRTAAIVGPLIGVWVGTALSRRSARESFMRERIFAEIGQRREVVSTFKAAIWAYSSRAKRTVGLAQEAADLKSRGEDFKAIKVDRAEVQKREDEVRQAFAVLESFSSVPVQITARDCMEAVTKAFNAAAQMEVEEAMALLAFYSQRYEAFAQAFNREIEDYNAIMYSSFTPIWRAILDRARRKPLPYHVHPFTTALVNPAEKVER